MFTRNKSSEASGGKIQNVLGPSTSVKGQIKSEGNIRLDGMFEGTVETTGNVIIGQSAKVVADINANAVQIWGAVKGSVVAAGRLEIMGGGRLWGSIRASSLLIDEGAIFRGQSFMSAEEPEPLLIESELGTGPADIVDAQLSTEPIVAKIVVEGYCLKCRDRRAMLDPEQTAMKNGRLAIRGKCPVCSATMIKIGELPTDSEP